MASRFTITAELSLQTKNLNQVVRNLQSQFNNANLNVRIKDLAAAQSQIQGISKSSRQASRDVGVLGNSMEQAFKRFTVITAVTGTLIAFTRAVKRSIGDAIDFEREVVKIAQATGQTVSQLKGLIGEIDSVSSTFGVASKELILASRSLTQAGFSADKVAGALKVLAQTELAATFDSIQDTTEGAIALLNQFGRTAQKAGTEIKFLEQSFSAINQVSKEFAVESADLVTAIRTTGSAFESAGGNLNELLALFTSVRSTTRESAESIATGFRTIFTRVQRVDTINALKALGIELQDAEGKFIGPLEAVKRLSTALNTIDPKDFRFNLVVEELGGFRQVSKVIPLIQQFAVAQKALNVAQNSSGSLAKDAQTAQQALAVQIARTREEFQKFMREMVASDTFQSTVRTVLDLANAFLKVADSVKPLIPLIATFGAMKAGAALVPALRSFAGSGKRGGIPIGFASGGLVPGSGNGDTVPAMLTPGEFVIRKSSVDKIGASNLSRINKYADGGRVTLIPKANRYGIFALEPEGEDDKNNYSTGVKVKNKDVAKQLINQLNLPKDSEVAVGGFLKSFHIGNDAQNNVRQTFKDSTEKSFSRMITDVSNDVSKKVGSAPIDIESYNLKSAIKSLFNEDSKSARSAIEGYVLEGVSSVISGAKLAGGQERWDFPNPAASAEGLAKLFGKEQEIAALNKGDVKRTDNSEARADVRSNKLARTLLENPEEIAEIVGDKASKPKKESIITDEAKASEQFRLKMIKAYGGNSIYLRDKQGNISPSSSNISKFAGSGPFNVVSGILQGEDFKFGKNAFSLTRDQQANVLSTLRMWKKQPPLSRMKNYFGGTIERFASGGFASGTDTVPAMLTPGEFVINKKSAQRIGYANLNRMNKVGKYAQGGVVSTKPFKVGGKVNNSKDEQFSIHPDVSKIKFSERSSDNAYFEKASKALEKDNKRTDYEVLIDGRREVITEDLPSGQIGKGVSALLAPALFSSIEELQSKLKPGISISGRDYIENLFSSGNKENIKYSKFIDKSLKIALLKFRKEYEKNGYLSDKSLKELGAYFYKSQGYSKDAIKSLLENTDMTTEYGNLNSTIRELTAKVKGRAGGWYQASSILDDRGSLYIDPEVAERASLRSKKAGRNVSTSEILGRTFVHELEHNAMSTFLSRDTYSLRNFYNENKKEIVEAMESIENRRGLKLPYGHNLQDIIKNKTGGNERVAIEEIFTQLIQFSDIEPKASKLIQKVRRQLYSKQLKPQYRESGGSIFESRGTDTVPAMLTPGEFVVNKKSAQRIGYANLNRMNKVGKYANGGVVQHFARGGSVGKGGTQFDVNEQRSQLAAFIRELRGVLDPKKAKLLKDTFKGIINSGGDVAKSIEQARKDIRIRQQNPQMLAGYLSTPNDAQSKRIMKKYIDIGAMASDDLKKKMMESLAAEEARLDASNRAITNLTIFGGMITSVISQMGVLNDKNGELVSTFSATIATVKGFGSNMTSAVKGMANSKLRDAIAGGNRLEIEKAKAFSEKANKGMRIADTAVSGFAAAVAVSATNSAYFGQKVDDAAKQVTSFVDALIRGENVSEFNLTGALKAEFQAAENQRARLSKSRSAVAGGIGLVAGGIAASNPATAAFAPIVAMGVSGVMDEVLWQLGLFGPELEKVGKQAEELGKALYSSIVANREFEKFFKDVDKSSDKDLATQSSVLEKLYFSQASKLSEFKPEDIANNQSKKDEFNRLNEASRDTVESLIKIQGEMRRRAANESGEMLKMGLVPIMEDLMKREMDLASVIATTPIQQEIEKAKKEKKPKKVELLQAQAGAISDQVRAEVLAEGKKISLTQAKMEKSLLVEIQLREKLIGSIQKQLAISAASERMTYDLAKLGDATNDLEARFSGSLTGLSDLIDVEAIRMNMPEESVLRNALDPISQMGSVGKELAQNIISVNKVVPFLEAGLKSLGQEFTVEKKLDLQKWVEDSFGLKKGDPVGEALAKFIDETMKGSEGSAVDANKTSLKNPETQKRIADMFNSMSDAMKEQAVAIGRNINEAAKQQMAAAERWAQSVDRQNAIALESIDSMSAYAQAIATARGKELSLAEKNYFRAVRQNRLVGKEFNSADAIANRIIEIGKTIDKNKPNEAKKLVAEQTRLIKSLDLLSNQADKTADILAEIEKVREKRESIRDLGKEFAVGTEDERGQLSSDIQAAMTVAATGTFRSIPEEMRKGANAILERFADFPGFKEAQNRAIANEFMMMGAPPQFAQMVMAESTPIEEQLKEEIRQNTLAMIAAQAARAKLEQENQKTQNDTITEFAKQIGLYTSQLNTLVVNFQADAEKKFGQKADFDARNMEMLNDHIFILDTAVKASAKEHLDNMDAVKRATEALEAFAKKTEEVKGPNGVAPRPGHYNPNAKPQAKGGLIYRAGGGTIFKPKGTDTVPAMLTPGEFIIKKSSVDKLGTGLLDQINAGHFASGGIARALRRSRYRRLEEGNQFALPPQAVPSALYANGLHSRKIAIYKERARRRRGGDNGVMPVPPVGKNIPNFMGQQTRQAPIPPAPIVPPFNNVQPPKTKEFKGNSKLWDEELFSRDNTKIQEAVAKQDALIKKRAELGKSIIASLPKKTTVEEDKAKRNKIIEDIQRRNLYAATQPEDLPKSSRPNTKQDFSKEREAAALARINVPEWRIIGKGQYERTGYEQNKKQYVDQKYGSKKPKDLPLEVWYDRIAKSQEEERKNFNKEIIKKGLKSKLSDYGKAASSPYSWELQKELEKAKQLGKKADDMMAKKFGVQAGKKYQSVGDVPVLSVEDAGRTVSRKQLEAMERQASSDLPFYYDGTPLSRGKILSNEASQKFKSKNTYEGKTPMSRYLNARSKLMMNEAIRNRYKGYAQDPRTSTKIPMLKITNPYDELLNYRRRLASPKPMYRSGGGNTDSVPAMLTPGEYVINSKSVGKYGKAFMDHLNRGGKVLGFARGGPVSSAIANANAGFTQNRAILNEHTRSGGFGGAVRAQELGGMEEFGVFIGKFEEAVSAMKDMTMTHHLTVDGQLNIAGIDGQAIAAQISQALGTYVGNIVQQHLNKQNRRPGT